MTPASFPKPPLTIDQQIDLLLERGLSIPDREHARHLLTTSTITDFGPIGCPLNPKMPAGNMRFAVAPR